MARPPCYQCSEDLEAIRAKSTAAIRAWGKQQLIDADAALLGVPTAQSFDSDWDVITDPEPDPDITNPEPDPDIIHDAEEVFPTKPLKPKAAKVQVAEAVK